MNWKFWKVNEYKTLAIQYGEELIKVKTELKQLKDKEKYYELATEQEIDTLRQELKKEICDTLALNSIEIIKNISGKKFDKLSKDEALENARHNYIKLQNDYFQLKQAHDKLAIAPWNSVVVLKPDFNESTTATNYGEVGREKHEMESHLNMDKILEKSNKIKTKKAIKKGKKNGSTKKG